MDRNLSNSAEGTFVIIILEVVQDVEGCCLVLLPGKEVDKANKFRQVDGGNPQGHLFLCRHKRVVGRPKSRMKITGAWNIFSF